MNIWKATIESSTFQKGLLFIGVSYSNGEDTFTESYQINSESDIDARISSKLEQLNSVQDISVVIGEYVPKPLEVGEVNVKQTALNNLRTAKELLDLGIITNTDSVFTDAVDAAKTAFTSDMQSETIVSK